jgi:DNA-binding MarR family transcriptional regulator
MASTADDLGLVDALVQLSFAVQRILGAIAARNDLSITQVRMLGILRDREPGMLELARALDLEKSSVSGLVDRAQKRGLVARTAGAHADGRAVHVRLTPEGAAVAARFADEVAAELSTLTDGLPAADRSQLSRLASRLVSPDTARRSGEP